uniref:Tetratricopeptide repeat-containing protein n=1 Tax=Chromera velia CCMP2878 TaxID=1169474 RepID=A0A0G4I5R7_9ALVE|eukprot:Cvel_11212.t1-p1 / transcript=Cvel_11212.t1 / gene=Cvel_11212 / organism=Chromera_velia_CCMP2878 / gene_product=hypothetical protein / transcript_product=hypothetical protein / location=Cvel_scaffold697:36207-39018(-) / protein_length=625 / sequence_SO=supercontig / SO=protein_coding / is_pseudo=false
MCREFASAFRSFETARLILPDVRVAELWYAIGLVYAECGAPVNAEACFKAVLHGEESAERRFELKWRTLLCSYASRKEMAGSQNRRPASDDRILAMGHEQCRREQGATALRRAVDLSPQSALFRTEGDGERAGGSGEGIPSQICSRESLRICVRRLLEEYSGALSGNDSLPFDAVKRTIALVHLQMVLDSPSSSWSVEPSLRAALRRDPSNVTARVLLALLLIDQGPEPLAEAAAVAERLIEELQSGEGKDDGWSARRDCGAAASSFEDDKAVAAAHYIRALILIRQQHWQEAHAQLQAAIKTRKNCAAFFVTTAGLFVSLKQTITAMNVFKKALKLSPDLDFDGITWHNIGIGYAAVGQWGEAQGALKNALAFLPFSEQTIANLKLIEEQSEARVGAELQPRPKGKEQQELQGNALMSVTAAGTGYQEAKPEVVSERGKEGELDSKACQSAVSPPHSCVSLLLPLTPPLDTWFAPCLPQPLPPDFSPWLISEDHPLDHSGCPDRCNSGNVCGARSALALAGLRRQNTESLPEDAGRVSIPLETLPGLSGGSPIGGADALPLPPRWGYSEVPNSEGQTLTVEPHGGPKRSRKGGSAPRDEDRDSRLSSPQPQVFHSPAPFIQSSG